ncbi:tetratricopeptide repeat protein [Bythopirellula polymerisocia]|nr:tetratricopeptide repeat protein [Bythopirellula polymerisocia]
MRISELSMAKWGFTLRQWSAAVTLMILASVTTAPAAELETIDSPATNTIEALRYPGKEMKEGFLNSAKQIEALIQDDPDEAANYVGLADVQIFLWCYGFAPHAEVMPLCETSVKKALELDPNLAAAHTTLGVVLLGQRDWDAAERHLRLGIELEPTRAQAQHWYALYLAAMGRHDEARKQSLRSFELDYSSGMTIGRSSILYFERDWQGMIDLLKPTIERDESYGPAYDWLGMAYVQEQQFDKAIETYRRAVELSDSLAEVLAGLGHAYAISGREEEARQVLDKLHRLAKRWHVPPVQIAFVHVGLGENQEAIDLLEKAYEQRSWELVFMQVEPWLDELRTEPRFIALIEKMKFPK